jgi:hypothetical protein
MGQLKYSDKGVPYSEKSGSIRSTLEGISIKNLQAMKLMNEGFRLKEQMGRKNKSRSQSGESRGLGLYELGSSGSVRLPRRK